MVLIFLICALLSSQPASSPVSQPTSLPASSPASAPASMPEAQAASLPASAQVPRSLPASAPRVVVEPGKTAPGDGKGPALSIRTEVVEASLGALLEVAIARGEITRALGLDDFPEGIQLPAARLRLESKLEDLLGLSFSLEAELSPLNQALFPLAEAHFSFDLASRALADLGRIGFGQVRAPFGLEASQNREEQTFIEQALYSVVLAPGRQVGVFYSGGFRKRGLGLDLGLFSGNGPNALDEGGQLVVAKLGGRLGAKTRAGPSLTYSLGFASGDLAREGASFPGYRMLEAGALFQWRQVAFFAEVIGGATDASGGIDALGGALWAEYFLIPEYLALVARAEELRLEFSSENPELTRRFTVGGTLFYLQERYRLQYNAVFTREQGVRSRGGLFSFVLVL